MLKINIRPISAKPLQRPVSAVNLKPKIQKDELIQAKQQINELVDENKKLRTSNMHIKKELQRYENVDENLINSQKLLGRSYENSLLPTLKYKIRIQQQEIDTLRQQLRDQSKSVKLTTINELEYQIQEQQEEIIKMQGMLNEALRISSQETKNNKYLSYLSRIEDLKSELMTKSIMLEKFEKENKQLHIQLKKQVDHSQQLSSEKTTIAARLTEQIQILQKELQNKDVNYVPTVQPEEQQQIDINKMKNLLLDKDQQIYELQDNIKLLKKDLGNKVNSQLQHIEQQNALLNIKDSQIQNLNGDILNLKQTLKQAYEEQKRILSSKVTSDASVQHPIQANDIDLDIIRRELKFKLRRRWIPQKEIGQLMFGNHQIIDFNFLKSKLIEFPFNLDQEQAHHVTLYLLTPEDSDPRKSKQVEQIPIGVLQSRAFHLLQPYDIITPDQEAQLYSSLTRRLSLQQEAIIDLIKQIKKSEKSTIPPQYCNLSQLSDSSKVIFENGFTAKELDYISQISYEQTGQAKYLDIQKIFKIFNLSTMKYLENQNKSLISTQSQTLFQFYKEKVVILPSAKRFSIQQQNQAVNNSTSITKPVPKMIPSYILIEIKPKTKVRNIKIKASHVIFDFYREPIKKPKLQDFSQQLIEDTVPKQTQTLSKVLQEQIVIQLNILPTIKKHDLNIGANQEQKDHINQSQVLKPEIIQHKETVQEQASHDNKEQIKVAPIQKSDQNNVGDSQEHKQEHQQEKQEIKQEHIQEHQQAHKQDKQEIKQEHQQEHKQDHKQENQQAHIQHHQQSQVQIDQQQKQQIQTGKQEKQDQNQHVKQADYITHEDEQQIAREVAEFYILDLYQTKSKQIEQEIEFQIQEEIVIAKEVTYRYLQDLFEQLRL